MRAWTLKDFGGIENLELAEVSKPMPLPGEVLVKIEAISVNPVEIKTREGFAQASSLKKDKPMILGWDLSGIVEQVGADVVNFKQGDEVFGMVNFPGSGRTYSEYATAPWQHLSAKPSNIDHESAAAASMAALTAWKAVVTYGQIQKGQKILIHGASGGVGHYAVQIAKYFGGEVTATASGSNRDFVMNLGADHFIDYKIEKFEEVAGPMDVIIDSVGGENFAKSVMILKEGGVIVNLPTDKADAAQKIADEKGIKNFYQMLVKSDGNILKSIAGLLASGALKSFIGAQFNFENLPQAQVSLKKGGINGKIAVKI